MMASKDVVVLTFNRSDIKDVIKSLLIFDVPEHTLDSLTQSFYDMHELKDYKRGLRESLESLVYDMDIEAELDKLTAEENKKHQKFDEQCKDTMTDEQNVLLEAR